LASGKKEVLTIGINSLTDDMLVPHMI